MRTALTVTGGPGTALAGAGPVRLEIAVPGRHYALNAAAALGMTVQLGVTVADAAARPGRLPRRSPQDGAERRG